MALLYIALALIAYVIMHLVAQVERRSLDAAQQQASAIGRDEAGRINLPNPWA